MGAVRFDVVGVNSLVPNDDGSSPEITLPFTFMGFSSCWVNNNGNISFTHADSDFTPDYISDNGPSISAYFGDVDTRSDPLNITYVKYGTTTLLGQSAFVATWYEVGYYSYNYDLRATFQIILFEDNGFEINYDKVEWVVGEASEGYPARAGFYLPDGAPPWIAPLLTDGAYEFPGSGTGEMVDSGDFPLVAGSRLSNTAGRYRFSAAGVLKAKVGDEYLPVMQTGAEGRFKVFDGVEWGAQVVGEGSGQPLLVKAFAPYWNVGAVLGEDE